MSTAGRSGSNILIIGAKETITALREFTPDVERKLDNTIKDALRVTAQTAKGRYPKGSWIVGRSKKRMLGYVAARAGGGGWGGKALNDLSPGTRAAILEFIGTAYSGSRPQVTGLIATMNSRYGSPGRFLWQAWDSTGANTLATIDDAMRQAEAELQARLNALGEGF